MHQQTLPIPQRFKVVNPAPVLEALSAHPARTAGPDAAPSQNVYEEHYGAGWKVWDKFEVIQQQTPVSARARNAVTRHCHPGRKCCALESRDPC